MLALVIFHILARVMAQSPDLGKQPNPLLAVHVDADNKFMINTAPCYIMDIDTSVPRNAIREKVMTCDTSCDL
jgi:hypothetical protein